MALRHWVSLLLALLAYPHLSLAVDLSQAKIKEGARVGFFLGSFDPFHFGHELIVKSALENANLDYVLVVPTDMTFDKNLSDINLRIAMLREIYKENPQILVADTYFGFPMVRKSIIAAKKVQADIRLVGIMGEDNATRQSALQRFGGQIMPEIKEWLVMTRDSPSQPVIPKRIGGKPVKVIEGPPGFSSTKVRTYLRSHPAFYNGEFPSPEILPLHESTMNFIRKHGLYREAPAASVEGPINCISRIFKMIRTQ